MFSKKQLLVEAVDGLSKLPSYIFCVLVIFLQGVKSKAEIRLKGFEFSNCHVPAMTIILPRLCDPKAEFRYVRRKLSK